MKINFWILILVVILAGSLIVGISSYFEAGQRMLEQFKTELGSDGLDVTDITDQYLATNPNAGRYYAGVDIQRDFMVLSVESKQLTVLFVEGDNYRTLLTKLKKQFSSPIADFFAEPHLYTWNKGIIVIYFGSNDTILQRLDELCENALQLIGD